MEDLERYGDYTEYEDDIPKKRSGIMLFFKIAIAAVCILVVGLLTFRIIMFNYYPEEMKTVYFNDTLTEHYNSCGGDISVKTQSLRAPYDNEKSTTFIADKLFVIEEAGQLQITLRYNKSLADDICEIYGIDEVGEDTFSFALFKNNPDYDAKAPTDEYNSLFLPTAQLADVRKDSSVTYNYFKIIFDDVDFENTKWLSVAIYINGARSGELPLRIAIYENNEDHSAFIDYKLSEKERPTNE